VLPSRPLLLVTLVGLLAASCNSAVVTTPYGQAIAPPRIEHHVSSDLALAAVTTAVPSLAPEAELAPDPAILAYDVAPRRLPSTEVTQHPNALAYDVAPRRLDPDPGAGATPPLTAAKALLGPLPFISQTANNCGPASVAEVLAFWGINRGQAEVQSVLRGDGNPYGMTPAGVPSYVSSLGLDALLGTAGTAGLMKELLRAGFPVIVNQTVSNANLELHYRPIEGFDDERGVFIASDPLIGPQYAISYAEFEQDWVYTGHRFMVVYPPNKLDALNAALAAGKWDAAYAEGAGQAQSWSVASSGPQPVTSPVMAPPPATGDWYTGPVKIAFKATDQSGFGVANTSYSIDKQPAQLYRGEFTIKDAGKHTLTFRSVNFSGSREPDKTAEIDIDDAPPSTLASVEGARDPGGAYKTSPRVTLAATDDGSGVAKTVYSLDGGQPQPYSSPFAVPAGAHTITYSSVDQTGNQEINRALTVAVEMAPVASASGVAVAAGGAASAAPPPSGAPAGGYRICPLFDPAKANKMGTSIAIKLQLCDAGGKNLSQPSVALTLQSILGPPTGFKPSLPSAFRYEASFSGYQADEGPGMGQGAYVLYFTAADDPAIHSVQFRIG
jgi:hypothetical protein